MPIGSAAILACHLGYYMVFLNRFPSHRALREQWSLAWLYTPRTFIPALLMVGVLAAIRLMPISSTTSLVDALQRYHLLEPAPLEQLPALAARLPVP